MKTEKINYKFIPVPQKLYKVLDNNCQIVMTVLIELDSVFANTDGWFFRSNSDLIEETKLSKNLLNAVLVTLNRNNLLEVHKPNRNVNTNSYRINFDEITRYDSIPFENLKKIEIKTLNYKDPSFKVTFTEVHPVNTSKDNSSPSEHNNILYNIKDNSNNIDNNNSNNIDNNNSNNIDNNNIYYSVHAVNNTKVNCFLTKEEIESYDNSKNVNSNTANAESGIEESVNSNEVIPNNNLDNSNEENTAVLSHFNQLNEESVISTKKTSENGLKQAKTRELGIVNKTDNSNSVKPNSTANAEIESNNSDNSKNVKPNEEGIEEKNKTNNSNEGISNSIAEGDNSTANAVPEFRDKCTNYTIILEGEKIEIGEITPKEFVAQYYSELMKNIYDTKEFDKQRKIFSKMIVDNHLTDTKYDQMCDNLDVRYSRYVQLDKQANKQTEKEEFTQEEVKYIANELLKQCLQFTLTKDNQMQDFYNLRNNYNLFIEEYNLPKEGLKLQKKFAELSVVNKKLNTPVNSQSFAV